MSSVEMTPQECYFVLLKAVKLRYPRIVIAGKLALKTADVILSSRSPFYKT